MNENFYNGDNRLIYCVNCGIEMTGEVVDQINCCNCGQKLRNKYAALALSGGGYRAALFHLGSLWRLNEMGWLKYLAEITGVSGGAITAAYLGLRWKELGFDERGFAGNFPELIVTPLRKMCSKTIDVDSVILGCLDPFHRPVDYLAASYRRELFGKATLQVFPSDSEGPRFTIYSTNLQTGVNVRFAKPYLADYHLGKISAPEIPLAIVVAASCALPPVLSPMVIKLKQSAWQDWANTAPETNFDKTRLRNALYLTDGGVYDNLGLERIWDRYATVLVSDAGAPFRISGASFTLRISELARALRAVNIVTNQTRALRKRWLISNFGQGIMKGTYWGIGSDIRNYQSVAHSCSPPLLDDSQMTRALSRVRTRLSRFSPLEQERLINWGYALTDAAMRRHVIKAPVPPGNLPYAIQ